MFILGLIVICVAPTLGQVAGDRERASNPDTADERYFWIISTATATYRISGIIISFIGSIGVATNWSFGTNKNVK